MSYKNLSRSRGFALIFTLTLVILIVLIIATFYLTSYNELVIADKASNSIRAYYTAEAGIAKKFMDLRDGNINSLTENFPIITGVTGNYSVAVDLIPGGTFSTYQLTSTGTCKGSTRHILVKVKQISCARFAYLSNDEDMLAWGGPQPIWFITGDIIRGPLHSNDTLNISGDPVFEGPVSSSSTSINYSHGGPPNDNPDFKDSLSLGVPNIQLPTGSDMINSIKTQSQQTGGLYLTGNTIITLLADGTMSVTNDDKGWYTPHNMPNPVNGAVFVNSGYADISGVLNGQLTVGTSNSIYVVDNLRYHDDPRVNPASNDLLGLVAQNNVYVDKYAPYNMEIDAYIVALNTSFGVENYDGPLKGTLTLYGGLTQVRRGPVGTFNSHTGQKASGYTKNYNYDPRLQNMAPLYFPPAKDINGRVIYIKTLYTES